jgi:16S rRNA (guanine527-N7)-methyltransferase
MIPAVDTGGGGALDAQRLVQVAADLGCALSADEVAACELYAAELVAWNRRLNLTRLTTPEAIAVQHLADSLVCLWGLPPGQDGPAAALDCVDVGTGAGLPGLALKIVRPAWQVTLVDAAAKKVAFVAHAIDVLGLTGAVAVHARAEDLGRAPHQRAAHDVAVARAVAALPVLAEYLLPLVRVGGRMLALKGADIAVELAALDPALALLGGRLVAVQPYRLPGLDTARHLVVVEKTRPTPAAYPRRAGLPAQRPLGGERAGH